MSLISESLINDNQKFIEFIAKINGCPIDKAIELVLKSKEVETVLNKEYQNYLESPLDPRD